MLPRSGYCRMIWSCLENFLNRIPQSSILPRLGLDSPVPYRDSALEMSKEGESRMDYRNVKRVTQHASLKHAPKSTKEIDCVSSPTMNETNLSPLLFSLALEPWPAAIAEGLQTHGSRYECADAPMSSTVPMSKRSHCTICCTQAARGSEHQCLFFAT